MEVPVFDLGGVEVERISPLIFDWPVREDVIHKVFVHMQSHRVQPQGRDPLAGKKTSAESFGVGRGMARLPRIKSGPQRGRAAFSNMAVGGRRPHVTTPLKRTYKRINRKERLLATASAASATGDPIMVARRGHAIERLRNIPLLVTDDIEEVSNTREFMVAAETLGLTPDIERVRRSVKVVGGKASWRGRRIKHAKGPLMVCKEDSDVYMAARNVLGVDVISARNLSLIHLAPGGIPGRLTLWSRLAVEAFEKRLEGKVRKVSMDVRG